jgi:hypothetical protein
MLGGFLEPLPFAAFVLTMFVNQPINIAFRDAHLLRLSHSVVPECFILSRLPFGDANTFYPVTPPI